VTKPKPKKKFSSKEAEYKHLKEVWYKKLERSGFDDIEHDEQRLKQWSFKFYNEQRAYSWESRNEYYSMAGRFLHDYKFKNNFEKTIWEYHMNALSVRDIAKLLRKIPVSRIKMKANKDNVLAIIKRLVHEMKKMYMPGYDAASND
jgi:hypothetical protein